MCVMGVSMSWAHFLVEEFILDFLATQELKKPFHYSWLLILIALVGWAEPPDCVFINKLAGCCEALSYSGHWYKTIDTRWRDNNDCFVVYHINIEVSLISTSRILEETVAKYGHIAAFKVDMHHLYICARLDASWTWLPLPYRVSDAHIEEEIFGWKEKWRPIVVPLSTVYLKRKKKMQTEATVTGQA